MPVRFGAGVRRRARPMRRRVMRRVPRAPAIRYNKIPSFVENYAVEGTVASQSGGVLGTNFALIPQVAQYTNLYNQYRINWVQYTIMPQWNSYDPSTGGGAISAPRIVFSIQDTAADAITPPLSEADVLLDNGCKIRMLDKPVIIRHKPVPQVGVSSGSGGFASISKKMTWFDTNSTAVPHGWVNYWITNGGTAVSFKVYVKVSFSLKDPK